ncbi:MAG: hypothetical protein H6726_24050 [Sandaracinaceae bacterium]|nr:hypothetical protein [Myxococcales bacterium]MCB9660739.1 hypothetical protein [Sandaracinaceae bacterium]
MKKLFVPVVCALVGCAAGVAMPALTAQSYGAPAPGAQRWEAYCAFEETLQISHIDRADGQREYNNMLQRLGSQGWEYVGPFTGQFATPCFRRHAQ